MISKKQIALITIFIATIPLSSSLAAPEVSGDFETQLVNNFVPSEFSSAKDSSTGKNLKLGIGIQASYASGKLDRDEKFTYVVIAYQATLPTSGDQCKLLVVKLDKGNKAVLMGPTADLPDDNYSGCNNIEILALDKKANKQVLLQSTAGRSSTDYHLFNWDGNKLVDITPLAKNIGGKLDRSLGNVTTSESEVNGKKFLISRPYDDFSMNVDQLTRVYQLANNQLKMVGQYDYFELLDKRKFKDVKVLNPSFPTEGTYTLTLKNISDHNRAVRAEVYVNGSLVLKSQDFCESPQPKRTEKDKWKGNDDDDDNDVDDCKRCVSKSEAYAIVNLKTTNEIKIKMHGRMDSAIQLTLVKRP